MCVLLKPPPALSPISFPRWCLSDSPAPSLATAGGSAGGRSVVRSFGRVAAVGSPPVGSPFRRAARRSGLGVGYLARVSAGFAGNTPRPFSPLLARRRRYSFRSSAVVPPGVCLAPPLLPVLSSSLPLSSCQPAGGRLPSAPFRPPPLPLAFASARRLPGSRRRVGASGGRGRAVGFFARFGAGLGGGSFWGSAVGRAGVGCSLLGLVLRSGVWAGGSLLGLALRSGLAVLILFYSAFFSVFAFFLCFHSFFSIFSTYNYKSPQMRAFLGAKSLTPVNYALLYVYYSIFFLILLLMLRLWSCFRLQYSFFQFCHSAVPVDGAACVRVPPFCGT